MMGSSFRINVAANTHEQGFFPIHLVQALYFGGTIWFGWLRFITSMGDHWKTKVTDVWASTTSKNIYKSISRPKSLAVSFALNCDDIVIVRIWGGKLEKDNKLILKKKELLNRRLSKSIQWCIWEGPFYKEPNWLWAQNCMIAQKSLKKGEKKKKGTANCENFVGWTWLRILTQNLKFPLYKQKPEGMIITSTYLYGPLFTLSRVTFGTSITIHHAGRATFLFLCYAFHTELCTVYALLVLRPGWELSFQMESSMDQK